MGCCQHAPAPPPEASLEEKSLSTRENTLGYGGSNSKDVVDEILRLADDGKFSNSDFNTLAERFKLDLEDMDTLDAPLNGFYRHLKEKGGAFNVSMLAALAVVLGRGTTQEKAHLLYTIAKIKNPTEETPSNILSAEQVDKLLDLLFSLCCVWLPQLSAAGETISDPGTLPKEKIDTMVGSYEAKKLQALTALRNAILDGHEGVSQAEFEFALAGPKLRGLTTSFDFRKSVLSQ